MSFEPIDLSRDVSHDTAALSPCGGPSDSGRHLYLDNPRVVELPEEGYVTFKFSRGPVTIREGNDNAPGSATVDLTLLEICEVKAEAVSSDGEEAHECAERTENKIDELFASLRGAPESTEGEQE